MSEDSAPMTSHRPYLLRALYEWISDNGMTPHLLVDANGAAVQVPRSAVKDGRIVLNVAERAVQRLEMGNDVIQFSARFGGVSQSVSVPVGAVLAIYARETGQGMALPEEAVTADGDDEAIDDDGTPSMSPGPAMLSAVPPAPSDGDDDDNDGPGHPTPRRAGHLRIVK